MPLTAEQREARRQGIGGSDAAVLMGRHPTKTPMRLWLDKALGMDDAPDGEWVEWGNLLEDAIAQETARRLGESVTTPTATVRHPLEPRMLANPDRLLSSGRVLECKNISDIQWRGSEDERVDGVLRAHFWQVQHYLEVLNAPASIVSYLIGGSKLEMVEVKRDAAIGKALRLRIGQWWARHVEGNEPPSEGTPADRMSLLERLHAKESAGMLKTDAADLIALAREYETASKAIDAATARRDGIKAELCAVIGAQEGLDFGKGIGKVTWKANRHGSRTLRVSLRDAQEQDQ